MIIRFMARVLRWTGARLIRASEKLQSQPQISSAIALTPHQLWLKENGDKTLRLNYSLGKEDIVLDVGGYEGQWASDIYSKYLCTIHIFEPVRTYADLIMERFEKNSQIHTHAYGLGNKNHELQLSLAGDASSTIVKTDNLVTVKIVEFKSWVKANLITKVTLIKINIEGGEYELLEHILETGLIENIENLQIQFHNFFPDAEQRMLEIQTSLQKTHELTYQYKFIWENWTLKVK